MTNAFVEQGEFGQAGDVGGDLQAGDAFSRVFVQPQGNGTYLYLEIAAFATYADHDAGYDANDEEYTGAYDVEVQTDTLFCTNAEDPGSTEISSDCDYETANEVSFDTLDAATEYAQNYIRNLSVRNNGEYVY